MQINLETKFEVGQQAFKMFLDTYTEIEILGIEIHIDKTLQPQIYYLYKPYNERHTIDEVEESRLLTFEEVEVLRKQKEEK